MDRVTNLNGILRSFKIKAECIRYNKVRNISFYDLQLAPGTRVKVLDRFAIEFAVALKSITYPIIRPMPNDGIVRLEVVDEKPQKIMFFDADLSFKPSFQLPMLLGNSVDGEDIWIDCARNPHMIIAGATGSGKSTLLHTIVANSLKLSETHLHIIDTKNIEFCQYTDRFKNLTIYDSYTSGLHILQFVYDEMDRRYKEMRKLGVSNANKANLSNIIFMIDEFADLIMQDDRKHFSDLLCKLAQKCRAANIFCIIATQRPSSDVISGSIKANFPARIACQVASGIDSKVVLDCVGAEKLSGYGDAIIKNYHYNYKRFQVSYTEPEEIISHYAS